MVSGYSISIVLISLTFHIFLLSAHVTMPHQGIKNLITLSIPNLQF